MSLVHWVWLSIAVAPGNKIIDEILKAYPNPEDFFLGGDFAMQNVPKLSAEDALRIRATNLDVAKAAIESAENYGAKIITKESEFYPQKLLEIECAPPVLYVLGDLTCLNNEPAVAIVGTRRMSEYGNKMAASIGKGLGAAGALVVSGMAAGVDSAAHKACLAAGGKTVAVQGCGICKTFPAENAELKELIAANGAVISEFTPDEEPRSSYFPIRNRIVSGMSGGVCVIEAAARSGTSITAHLAIDQGRKLFAVPGDVTRSTSQGTFRLLRQGAIPIADAKDILAEFTADETAHLDLNKIERHRPEKAAPGGKKTKKAAAAAPNLPPKAAKAPPPSGISKEALAVYEVLDREPKSADDISMLTGMPSFMVSVALTELELTGAILPASGRRFTVA